MRSMTLEGSTGATKIELGFPFTSIGEYFHDKRVVMITDSKVYSLFEEEFPKGQAAVLGSGELVKTLESAYEIYQFFLAQELDRSSCVVGIGGGVVCDIVGFCASTYLRGLPFGYVPTTLLAQVDASVGGKNGVNFKGYKNMVGTFNQPQFVLCDFKFLKTLPESEVRNGIAEVMKHALIGNGLLFSQLEENQERIMSLDENLLEEVVYESLLVKVGIVTRDERESGERRKLNFGHTLGHAVEKTCGLSHGDAVSIGMIMESKLSVMKGRLEEKIAERIKTVFEKLGLPVRAELDRDAMIDAVRKDKKREDHEIHCVLLDEIGSAKIARVRIDELEEFFDDLCEYC
jgi:3-dehydroquinate synthase